MAVGSGGRIRTFVARVKAACPAVGRLRNVRRCGRSRTFARGLMRPGFHRGAQRKAQRQEVTKFVFFEKATPSAFAAGDRFESPRRKSHPPSPRYQGGARLSGPRRQAQRQERRAMTLYVTRT